MNLPTVRGRILLAADLFSVSRIRHALDHLLGRHWSATCEARRIAVNVAKLPEVMH